MGLQTVGRTAHLVGRCTENPPCSPKTTWCFHAQIWNVRGPVFGRASDVLHWKRFLVERLGGTRACSARLRRNWGVSVQRSDSVSATRSATQGETLQLSGKRLLLFSARVTFVKDVRSFWSREGRNTRKTQRFTLCCAEHCAETHHVSPIFR